MIMEKEVVNFFLDSLVGKRYTREELEQKCQSFFEVDNHLEDNTDNDNKNLDYSVIFTSSKEKCAVHNFIDIEIYYLKMRNGMYYITETSLLEYMD